MDRKELIKEILYGYVACDSITCTKGERKAEEYFVDYFKGLPYFAKHDEYCGLYEIKDDPYNRGVCYAFVKGKSDKTVVLLHHNDVVTVEDYKTLKEFAFDIDKLNENLDRIEMTAEAYEDYLSGQWLFGRGVCDMKGGASIEMALLSEYSEEMLDGNVLVIGVPDEENLSAGMRSAVLLLKELKDKYHFDYRLMIDLEPHSRNDKSKGLISLGSIGKVMPCVSVRGFLAHVGKMFDGFNPCSLMGEIVKNTEANMVFSSETFGEVAPPPTWLYLRENKESYNVSMPLLIQGCLSVLTHNQSPAEVIEKLKKICVQSFEETIKRNNEYYHEYLRMGHKEPSDLPWSVNVCEYKDLLLEAQNDDPKFNEAYEREFKIVEEKIAKGEMTYITASFHLTSFALDHIKDSMPRVVIGLIPPYYPNVGLNLFDDLDDKLNNIVEIVNDFTKKEFSQSYDHEYFYTCISDLSYASLRDDSDIKECLEGNMPFIQGSYALPVDEMKEISMPSFNIGPWGKDLHKASERVNKEDLFVRTPAIVDHIIKLVLRDE